MKESVFFEIHTGLPREGPGGDEHTERAFRALPPMESPSIIDMGCGPGRSTAALARISGGTVIGLDTHQPYLDALEERVRREGTADRVRVLNRSMTDPGLPEGVFDLIWSEASIYSIGFDRALKKWRPLLKPGGCLAASELCWTKKNPPEEAARFWRKEYPAMRSVEENETAARAARFDVLDRFVLPDEAWWDEYYRPVEERVARLREKYAGDGRALAVLDAETEEIDIRRRFGDCYGYVFFVLQRSGW